MWVKVPNSDGRLVIAEFRQACQLYDPKCLGISVAVNDVTVTCESPEEAQGLLEAITEWLATDGVSGVVPARPDFVPPTRCVFDVPRWLSEYRKAKEGK